MPLCTRKAASQAFWSTPEPIDVSAIREKTGLSPLMVSIANAPCRQRWMRMPIRSSPVAHRGDRGLHAGAGIGGNLSAVADAQVFISYNSRDAALAAPVVAALQARGIRVWIDQEQLLPGRAWLPAVEQAITGCGAVAVLLGPNGLGPVHSEEMTVALSLARTQGKLEFPGPGDRTRAEALEARLDTWGRQLNDALFPGGAQHAVYHDIRDRLDRGERVLLTLASDSPAVLIRPWEMLRDGRGPLALRGLTVRRQLRTDQPPPAQVHLEPTLRLLLIVARPAETGFIDPRTSVRPVLDALDNLGSGPGSDRQNRGRVGDAAGDVDDEGDHQQRRGLAQGLGHADDGVGEHARQGQRQDVMELGLQRRGADAEGRLADRRRDRIQRGGDQDPECQVGQRRKSG